MRKFTNTSFSGTDMIVTLSMPNTDKFGSTMHIIGELQSLSYSLYMKRGAVRTLGNVNAKDHTNGPRTIAGSLVFAVFDRHIIYDILEKMNADTYLLADELPPFDVTISFNNEYNCRSVLRIYGIRLVNEGKVLSINDVYVENTFQYVASNIEYLRPLLEDNRSVSLYNKYEAIEKEDDVISELIPLIPEIDNSESLPGLPNEEVKSPEIKKIVVKDYTAIFKLEHPLDYQEVQIKPDDEKVLEWESYQYSDNLENFALSFDNGAYRARLKYKKEAENVVSDEKIFTIDVIAKGHKDPFIDKVYTSSIEGYIRDNELRYIVLENSQDHLDFEVNALGGRFVFSNLKPNTKYWLTSTNQDGSFITKPISVYTKNLKHPIFDELKKYYSHYIEQYGSGIVLSQIEEDFMTNEHSLISAFYVHAKECAELLRYINYFNLCYDVGTFKINNRWLNIIATSEDLVESYYETNIGRMHKSSYPTGVARLVQEHKTRLKDITLYFPAQDDYGKMINTYNAQEKRYKEAAAQLSAYCNQIAFTPSDYYDITTKRAGAVLSFSKDDAIISSHAGTLRIMEFPYKDMPYFTYSIKPNEPFAINKCQFLKDKEPFVIALYDGDVRLSPMIYSNSYCYNTLLYHIRSSDNQLFDLVYPILNTKADLYTNCIEMCKYLLSKKVQKYVPYLITAFDKYLFTTKDSKNNCTIAFAEVTFAIPTTVVLLDYSGELIEKIENVSSIKNPHNAVIIYYTDKCYAEVKFILDRSEIKF